MAQLKGLCGTERDCSESGNVIVCRQSPDAVQFGDMRPGMGSCGRLATNVMKAYLGCSSGDAA